MNDERLGIADIGQMRDQLEAVHELFRAGSIAFEHEGQDTTEAAGEILFGRGMCRMAGKAGIVHGLDIRMRCKPLGESQGIFTGALDSQGQCLQALQQHEGIERALAWTPVAQAFDTAADDELDVAKGTADAKHIVKHHAVIAGRRRGELRILAIAPVEGACIHDHATHAGAMTADPLRGGLDHDMRTEFQRLADRAASAEGVVHNQGQIMLFRQRDKGLEVRHGKAWIADGFEIDRFRLRIDQRFITLHPHAIREPGLDADAFEGVLELVVGAAVEMRGGDKVIANRRDVVDGDELR